MFRSHRSLALVSVIWALVGLLTLAGCAGTPVGQAKTLEQKVYALYGSFVIIQEQVAELTAEGSGLNRDTQLQLIRTVRRGQPVIDAMLDAFEEYEKARANLSDDESAADYIETVTASLENWVEQADSLVNSLRSALRGGNP